jgi:NitT/TauT family transport system substrate-binding protein
MKRSAFAAGTMAAVMSPAVSGAQNAAPVTIRLSGTGADDIAPVLYAQKAGLFRAVAIETVYERSNSGAATVAAVLGGSVDIGKSSLGSLISARARNIDLKINAGGALFRNTIPRAAVMLVVAADSPLRSGKDFAGKTISVPALGDQNSLAVKSWVDAQGGDSRTLSFLEIPSSAAAAAVAQGRVAAAALVPPYVARAVGDGTVKTIANIFAAIAPHFMETGWFSSADYAAKHRDLVARFAKVVADASGYVNAHVAETADALAAFSGVSSASILQAGISPCSTSIDVREIQPLIDAMAKYGLIDHRFDASDFLIK